MYCTYLTLYFGTKLPKRYIGSSSLKKVEHGYQGSVYSRKWRDIFKKEMCNNPKLFKTRVLSVFKDRQSALNEEERLHLKYDVVKSPLYMNESIARKNGYFGRDVSGKNNPMYGSCRRGETHKGGENISKSLKCFYNSEKGRKRKVLYSKESYKAKVSDGLKNFYNSNEGEKLKIKFSEDRQGAGNPNYGKKWSKEQRENLSIKKIGTKATNETKNKISENSPMAKKCKITYFDDKTEVVDNLFKFSKEHKISVGPLYNLLQGKKIKTNPLNIAKIEEI